MGSEGAQAMARGATFGERADAAALLAQAEPETPPGCSGHDAAVRLRYTTAPALTWMSRPVSCRLAELPDHPYPIGLRPVTSRSGRKDER